MQALAQNGNGQAAFIDTEQEARKVLVEQLAGALFPIAEDVKIQVQWDPATVADWRLIGYETRALDQEDFDDDRVDAGEVGAGTAVTALYEVRPTGTEGLLGTLRLRWKEPGEGASLLIEAPIRPDAPAGSEARFAAAIAGFGQLLRNSPSVQGWSYDQALTLARANRGPDPFGYRAEAVSLIRTARDLAAGGL
jgi:Ca-activated chloride channel family protein